MLIHWYRTPTKYNFHSIIVDNSLTDAIIGKFITQNPLINDERKLKLHYRRKKEHQPRGNRNLTTILIQIARLLAKTPEPLRQVPREREREKKKSSQHCSARARGDIEKNIGNWVSLDNRPAFTPPRTNQPRFINDARARVCVRKHTRSQPPLPTCLIYELPVCNYILAGLQQRPAAGDEKTTPARKDWTQEAARGGKKRRNSIDRLCCTRWKNHTVAELMIMQARVRCYYTPHGDFFFTGFVCVSLSRDFFLVDRWLSIRAGCETSIFCRINRFFFSSVLGCSLWDRCFLFIFVEVEIDEHFLSYELALKISVESLIGYSRSMRESGFDSSQGMTLEPDSFYDVRSIVDICDISIII